ncbi:HAD family hydrolase [Streptomyces aureus]
MSTLDERDGSVWVDTKGAPEDVIPRCTTIADPQSRPCPLSTEGRLGVEQRVDAYARQGLRVLAVAERRLQAGQPLPERREEAENELTLLGLVAMLDPPRPEVAAAVADCHTAGIRIIMVTGDHALTAAAIAHQLGIAGKHPTVITGEETDRMTEHQLDELLRGHRELIFARSSPETNCGSPTLCAPEATWSP